MKRSKQIRNSAQKSKPCKECSRSRGQGGNAAEGDAGIKVEPFAFKTLTFQELSISCVPKVVGDKTNGCTTLPVPDPRSGHRVVCEEGNMYSFGGYLETNVQANWPPHLSHGVQRLFQELWCYNFAEAQWKRLPTLGTAPKELASHSAVLHGNYLVVYGGTGVPFGGCSSNRMNICDLKTLEWKSVTATGDAPTPQYGQAVVMDKERKFFYTIGGTTGYDYSMDIHKLDMNSFEWESLFVSRGDTDEPQPRYRHEVAFDGTFIYILGGGTATNAFGLAKVPAFNVNTREWNTLETQSSYDVEPKFPTPRKCQGSVQLGDEVFICGGYDSQKIFMDLWKLHLPTMVWTRLSVEMPTPLYFHSTSTTKEGCLYIFGGVTHIKNNTRTNQVFKIWLQVPKLKEMCWEALLYYRPSIKLSLPASLVNLGIPKEFVDRVHPAPPCGLSFDTSEHWASDLLPSSTSSSKSSTKSVIGNAFRHGAPFPIGY